MQEAYRVGFTTLATLIIASLASPLLSEIDLSTAFVFEAATVKQNHAGDPPRGGIAPGRFTATNTPVLRLLQTAFDIQEDRIVNAPSWTRADGYDIVAKSPDGVPLGPNVGPMLRSLLKDRFGLTAHVETRDLPIYQLVVSRRDGKLGPKIQQSQCDCREKGAAGCPEGAPLKLMPELDGAACALLRVKGHGIVRGYPIADLGKMLTGMAGRVVVDRTGLSGTWNIELEFTPDQVSQSDPLAPVGPSLFAALEEQLGLKLQSGRGPVEVLVIDHQARPGEN